MAPVFKKLRNMSKEYAQNAMAIFEESADDATRYAFIFMISNPCINGWWDFLPVATTTEIPAQVPAAGWQAVLRTAKNGKRALLVAHTFGKPFPKSVEIPLPGAGWKVEEAWPAKSGLQSSLKGKFLKLDLSGEFRASVISLQHA
jgi:hypothetical protein